MGCRGGGWMGRLSLGVEHPPSPPAEFPQHWELSRLLLVLLATDLTLLSPLSLSS